MSTTTIIARRWTPARLAAARKRLRNEATRNARWAGHKLPKNARQDMRDAELLIREREVRRGDRRERELAQEESPFRWRELRREYGTGSHTRLRDRDGNQYHFRKNPAPVDALCRAYADPVRWYAPQAVCEEARRRKAARKQRRTDRQLSHAARSPESGRILRLQAERRQRAQEAREARASQRRFKTLEPCEAEIERLIADTYRGAKGRWAGGNNYYTVLPARNYDDCSAKGSGRRVWSKNGKWSGLNGHFTLRVQPTWATQVRDRGLAVLDGLVTIWATKKRHPIACLPDGGDVYRAVWVRQGRGLEIYAEHGWIAIRGDVTYHDTTSATHAAQGLTRKLRAQGIPQEVRDERRRQRQEAAARRRAEQVQRLWSRLTRCELADLEDVDVRIEDSLRAGNCEPGTLEFRERLFPGQNRESATLGEMFLAAQQQGLTIESVASLSRVCSLTEGRQFVAAVLQALRRRQQLSRI